ncbi:MiaE family protein [Aurantivibrio plasticivorans]
MIQLRFQTPDTWTQVVLADFNAFLIDHAAAEKKASGMAISMLSHYPDRPAIVKAMIDLAIEEMTHFRDVVRIMTERNIQLAADEKDPYINQFRKHIRKDSEPYLLDRLISAGIIEARGCERFSLIADAQEDLQLKRFYTAIGRSESRHATLFTDLAKEYFPADEVEERLGEMLDIEADIISRLPYRAALH